MKIKDSIIVGLFQCIALFPGVSRSGATIIAGKFAGLKSDKAAEYSFLALIPIMLGVVLKVCCFDHAYIIDNWPTLLVSNLVAFIAGMVAIGFMLKYLRVRSLKVFGIYRIVLAVVVLCLLIFVA